MSYICIGAIVIAVIVAIVGGWQARKDAPKRNDFYDNDPNVG
jgi:hypothetical protein